MNKAYKKPEGYTVLLESDLDIDKYTFCSEEERIDFWHSAQMRARNAKYYVRPGYVLRDIAGESLLIPVAVNDGISGKVGIVSPVGGFLWKLLQKEQTFSDLLKAVLQEYDVSPEEAKWDIRDFLQQLDSNQFLKIEDMEVNDEVKTTND